MTDSLKLLAVFPHPDDETLGLGSTFARYSVEGVQTFLVCATRGERGWFDSEGPNPGLDGISMDVGGVTRHHVGWEDCQITARLNNNEYLDRVQRAMLCHKSQLPGYGSIAEWSLTELATIFGTANFYRAFSLVNGGRKVEADLFEGLR